MRERGRERKAHFVAKVMVSIRQFISSGVNEIYPPFVLKTGEKKKGNLIIFFGNKFIRNIIISNDIFNVKEKGRKPKESSGKRKSQGWNENVERTQR